MREFFLVFATLFFFQTSFSQIAISTSSVPPHASSMLDITSTEKGLLIPRMSGTQKTAISSPAKGLLIFTDEDSTFWYYSGTGWVDLISASSTVWKRIGANAYNANSANVGIGTTAPTALLDVNGAIRVRGLSNSTGNLVRSDSLGRLSAMPLIPAANIGGFQTVLKSTTAIPVEGPFGHYTNPTSVAVSGSLIYVADYSGAIFVYNVSNPASPQLQSKIDYSPGSGHARDIVVSEGRIYVVKIGSHLLEIYGSGPPKYCSVVVDPKYLSLHNNLAFVSAASSQLNIIDVSGAQPVIRSTLNTFTSTWKGTAGSGNYLYALEGALKVYDISNPQSPQLISTTPTVSNAERVTIKGNLAYVVGSGMQIFDISNPQSLVSLSVTSTGSGSNRIEVHGNRAFVTNGTAMNLQVFDITTPQSPVLKSTTPTAQWPSGLAVNGNYAYVSINLDKKLQVFEAPAFSDGILAQNPDGSLISMPISTLSDNLGNHTVSQALRMNDQPLYLRGTAGAPNIGYGLQYSNTDNVDGPRLYGIGGGSLGSSNNTTALRWTNTGSVGIGTLTPSERLAVVGNITATGTINSSSDIRFKTNINYVGPTLSSLLKIQPIYYQWNRAFRGYVPERQLGFSAQEVEQYFPEIVRTDGHGYKSIDYARMTPLLLQAIKEQQQQIEVLTKAYQELKTKVEKLVLKQ